MTRRTPETTFEYFIGSRTRAVLLARLMTAPTASCWLRELCRGLGTGMGNTHRELQTLQSMGVIRAKRHAGVCFYAVNEEHPLCTPLRELLRAARECDDAGGWLAFPTHNQARVPDRR